MQARPLNDDVRLIEESLAPRTTPHQYEDYEEQVWRPGQHGFAERMLLEGQCATGVARHHETALWLPDFEEGNETHDRGQCREDVGKFRTHEVGHQELHASEANAAHD